MDDDVTCRAGRRGSNRARAYWLCTRFALLAHVPPPLPPYLAGDALAAPLHWYYSWDVCQEHKRKFYGGGIKGYTSFDWSAHLHDGQPPAPDTASPAADAGEGAAGSASSSSSASNMNQGSMACHPVAAVSHPDSWKYFSRIDVSKQPVDIFNGHARMDVTESSSASEAHKSAQPASHDDPIGRDAWRTGGTAYHASLPSADNTLTARLVAALIAHMGGTQSSASAAANVAQPAASNAAAADSYSNDSKTSDSKRHTPGLDMDVWFRDFYAPMLTGGAGSGHPVGRMDGSIARQPDANSGTVGSAEVPATLTPSAAASEPQLSSSSAIPPARAFTPRHNDTWVDESHRVLFRNIAAGAQPWEGGMDDVCLTGIAMAVPVLLSYVGNRDAASVAVRSLSQLTHKHDDMVQQAVWWGDLLAQLLAPHFNDHKQPVQPSSGLNVKASHPVQSLFSSLFSSFSPSGLDLQEVLSRGLTDEEAYHGRNVTRVDERGQTVTTLDRSTVVFSSR